MQDDPVYWKLPSGSTQCWSLREFHDATPGQLATSQLDKAYELVAKEFHFDVLGVCPEIEITELRNDPGTLSEKRWLQLHWNMPQSEQEKCWWLTNPNDDTAKPPTLLCRSFLCMPLELNQSKVGSTTKLRQAYERRSSIKSCVLAYATPPNLFFLFMFPTGHRTIAKL